MMEMDLKNYIEEKIPALEGSLYPVHTTELSKITVAYTVSPISGGHVKQSQLQLIVIGGDYDECKAVEQELKELLDMEEDSPFVIYRMTRFHSSISGGGMLFNDGCQMWEDTLYFIVDWRNLGGKEG